MPDWCAIGSCSQKTLSSQRSSLIHPDQNAQLAQPACICCFALISLCVRLF